ncbi:transaldolase [Piscirickettsia salmonis]|uniref:transaldolase n=1 Tax=Piscirickettsia salmonis TaxID=1238 RepID=UPI0007C9234F|nr:Transaldolase [Piscirickettsiaceae bacterium NZ-RLO1]
MTDGCVERTAFNPQLNQLEQLRQFSEVVADTGDIASFVNYQPKDVTTNPSLLYQVAEKQEYVPLVKEAIDRAMFSAGFDVDLCLDVLAVAIGRELLQLIPGVVSTEIDARLSFDSEAMIARAERLIALYHDYGIDKTRVLIKIASTWEGIVAARVLEQQGIHCNMTLVFSKEQAIACAEADAYLISPFVGRVQDWYKEKSIAYDGHPGIDLVREIHCCFKQADFKTVVMAASFRSSDEVVALSGCDRLTIPPKVLAQLQEKTAGFERALVNDIAVASDDPKIAAMTEAKFRWAMNQNPMAEEKLADGIRRFAKDTVLLEEKMRTAAKY